MNSQELAATYARFPIGEEYQDFFKKTGDWKVAPTLENKLKVLKLIGRECNKDRATIERIVAKQRFWLANKRAQK